MIKPDDLNILKATGEKEKKEFPNILYRMKFAAIF